MVDFILATDAGFIAGALLLLYFLALVLREFWRDDSQCTPGHCHCADTCPMMLLDAECIDKAGRE